jgi:hypothetical protein
MTTASPPALIDERRPRFDELERHERLVHGFAAFDRPGYAKVVWDFRLTTEGGRYSMSGTLALA